MNQENPFGKKKSEETSKDTTPVFSPYRAATFKPPLPVERPKVLDFAPAPKPERPPIHVPTAEIIELYNREAAEKNSTETSENSSEDDTSSETSTAKKKKTAVPTTGAVPKKPLATVIPFPARPKVVPDKLSEKSEGFADDDDESAQIAPVIPLRQHQSPAQRAEAIPTHYDSFGDLPPINERDSQSPLPLNRLPGANISYRPQPEQQQMDRDFSPESAAETEPSSIPHPTGHYETRSFDMPLPSPEAPHGGSGGGGGGEMPPPPGGNEYATRMPDPNQHPASFGVGETTTHFMGAPAASGAEVLPVVTANRDVPARVMAAVAGAGAFLGYKKNKRRSDSLEKITAAGFRDMQTTQEQFAFRQDQQEKAMRDLQQARQEQSAPAPAASSIESFAPIPMPRVEAPRAPHPKAVRSAVQRPVRSHRPEAATLQNEEAEQSETDASADSRPDLRIEHSAWHSYARINGKFDPNALEYGKGLREEQREILQDRTADAGQPVGAMATAASTNAGSPQNQYDNVATYQLSHYSQAPSLPSGVPTPTLPQGTLPADPQHRLPQNSPKEGSTRTFWVMLVIIVAAFFAALFI